MIKFVIKKRNINISVFQDMVIVRRDGAETPSDSSLAADIEQLPLKEEERREALSSIAMERIDDFVATHDLKIRVPKEIIGLAEYVPKSLIDIPAEVTVPLSSAPTPQGKIGTKSFIPNLKMKNINWCWNFYHVIF